jgi:glycosyltransferase involved in cell wall biosynthesis
MRLAVVSPFLDRQHGTERCIVEQIERFLRTPGCEVHIYAQAVRDLEVIRHRGFGSSGEARGRAVWHRIPWLPGPHVFNFLWWYLANQSLRWFHRTFHSLHFDVIFSPGINCADADAIVVHIVFHEFFRLVKDELKLRAAPLRSWPVMLHRLFYYRLIMALEKRIYCDPGVSLAAVSSLTAREVTTHFGREDVRVILNAVDLDRFRPEERLRRRAAAREALHFAETEFVALLIGNDWKKKGLSYLLQAVAAMPDVPVRVLIAGRDDRASFLAQMRELGIEKRVLFAEPSADVMQFFAAADVYAGPSLHDSFALPPLEAMACGLPVITSNDNGGAEVITEGCDGFVLRDPRDSGALAEILRKLYENPGLRQGVGESAARTAQKLTWERNARETWEFLVAARKRKEAQ